MTAILPLFFILTVSLGNFALGFGLAVYFGQGPDLNRWLPRKPATSPDSAAAAKPAH